MREIRTPGSAWGDGYKGPCRLGEATASKGAAPARLRKGYRSEACPYQPCHRPRMARAIRRAPHRGPTRRAAHPEMVERRRVGGGEANTDGGGDAAGRQRHAPYAKGNFQFERVIVGWRAQRVLDLRRKT